MNTDIIDTSQPSSSYSRGDIEEILAARLGPDRVPRRFRIITDTSDFFRVDYNDVVILAGRPYLIRNCEREGRFGLDDEPKYWVKRSVDLLDGATKIIKLVFHEQIKARVGDIVFDCVRSPQKEAAILDLVGGHDNFMHGFSTMDDAGNVIRILEFIRGHQFDDHVRKLNRGHEEYYYTHLPSLLTVYAELVKAIEYLHEHGFKHGDIRRDHILLDRETGIWRWIDFDFDYMHKSNMFGYDLYGLGNILIFLVGGGDVTTHQLAMDESPLLERLDPDDFNIIFNNRVANLGKIYPYISDTLNYILLHFSQGANLFYDNAQQLLDDLSEVSFS